MSKRHFLFGVAMIVAAVGGVREVAAQSVKSVAIMQIVEHPALDAIRRGVIDGMAQDGFAEGKAIRIDYDNAQGNPSTAAQIAKKFSGQKPDLVVSISTAASQATVASIRDTPIVFAGVTDPVAAKIVPKLETPGGMVTGMTNAYDPKIHLTTLKAFFPNMKRIGFLYNPGEINSVANLKRMEEAIRGTEYTLALAPAANSGEVQAAARSLVGRADIIYVTTDNTVGSAFESAARVSLESKIPLIHAEMSSAKRGAVIGIGTDYYAHGFAAGKIAARVLRGEKPGDISVGNIREQEAVVNLTIAEKLGLTFSPDALRLAREIIRN